MKLRFSVEPLTFQTLGKLPGAWDTKQYKDLLQLMEYEESQDLAEEELKELCYMALADMEEEKAAFVVLTYLLAGRLNKGQLENLAQEIPGEKLWEDFADLSLHETLFNVHQILYDSCKGGFPRPEALRFELRVTAATHRDLSYLSVNAEAGLIRLMVQGMPSNTKIARLYEKELLQGGFEDAKHILWQLRRLDEQESSLVFEGISSPYWFGDLKQANTFNSEILWDIPTAGKQ